MANKNAEMFYHTLICRSPTPKARAESLQRSDDQFRKSNESAYSVIPSQSSSFSEESHRSENSSERSLKYRPLGFEHVLFTSKVYIRNTKNMMIEKIRKLRDRSKGKSRVQLVLTLEATRNEHNAESLLLPSDDVPTEDEDIGYLLRPDKSPTPFFEQLLLGIANYLVSTCPLSYLLYKQTLRMTGGLEQTYSTL